MRIVLGRYKGRDSYGWQNMGSKHLGFDDKPFFLNAQTLLELIHRLRAWIEEK